MSDTELEWPSSPKSTCSDSAALPKGSEEDSTGRLARGFLEHLKALQAQHLKEQDSLSTDLEELRRILQSEADRKVERTKAARNRALDREGKIQDLEERLAESNRTVKQLETALHDAQTSVDNLKQTVDRQRLLDKEQQSHTNRLRTALDNLKRQNKELKAEAKNIQEEFDRAIADFADVTMRDRGRLGTSLLTQEVSAIPSLPSIKKETIKSILEAVATQSRPGARLMTRNQRAPVSDYQRSFEALAELKSEHSLNMLDKTHNDTVADYEKKIQHLKDVNNLLLKQLQEARAGFEKFMEHSGGGISEIEHGVTSERG